MTPPIPDDTMDAALRAFRQHGTFADGITAAWPHLRAAALHDVGRLTAEPSIDLDVAALRRRYSVIRDIARAAAEDTR